MVALALDTTSRRTAVVDADEPADAEQKASDKAYARSLLAFRNVYDSAGAGITAGAAGIDRGDLAKMLAPSGARKLWFQSVFGVRHLASAEQGFAMVEPLATHYGLHLSATPPVVAPMTDAERAARLEAGLLALGPVGAAMRDSMLGTSANACAAELAAAKARIRALEGQIASFQESFLGR